MILSHEVDNTLEDVEYLSRSPNRIRILEVLARNPSTTGELSDATEMSRATLGRILNELRERGWIERTGGTYAATQSGAFVVEEFTGMVGRLNTIQVLTRAARWFPEVKFGFDLQHLATAEVISTTRTDVLAPTSHVTSQIHNSDRVSVLSHAMLPDGIAASWERVRRGHQTVEAVVTAEVVASVRARPEVADKVREMVETDRAEIFRYDGEIPYVYVITDGEVNFVLFDEDGAPHAAITTDDTEVLGWAESTLESYREDATPLDRDAFAT